MDQQQLQCLTQYMDISNVLLEIGIALEKARYMQGELTDEYFSKPSIRTNQDAQNWLIADYDRYGVFADIVEDNLRVIEKKLIEVRQMVSVLTSGERKEED